MLQSTATTFLAVLLVTAAPRALAAQVTTATLEGTVAASDGNAPSGARVELRSRETGVVRTVLADDRGRYRVLGLAPDEYDVTVRALGFRPRRRERVRLALGQTAKLDVVLERGVAELEHVIVSANGASSLRRSDVSTTVLQEEIEKLPLNTRNVLNVAAIAPGIRTFAPEAGRSIPAAGALPATRSVNVYVDGLEWRGTVAGTVLGQPALGSLLPPEAIREFRVALNPYDAEYTRGASWIISAVTHRGSNVLEGSAFAHLQNRSLVARSSFQDRKPAYRRQQLGGSLRGPLVRDRLFFALSYEGLGADNHVDVVPGRPAAQPSIWDSLAGTFGAPVRGHGGVLRLTAPGGAHTLDATWATRHIRNESGFGTAPAGVMLSRHAGVISNIRLNSIQVSDTWASSSLLNELSLHVLLNTNDEFPLVPGPMFQYPGVQVGRPEFPLFIDTRHLRVANKTTWVVRAGSGQHTIKWGAEATHVRVRTLRPVNRDGAFFFAADTSTLPLRAQIGIGVEDPASIREATFAGDRWIAGAYLQDEWQPTASLAVTAGLRWDAEIDTRNQRTIAPWAADTSLLRALGEDYLNDGDRENDLDNLAPRASVRWDVSGGGRTMLRAGWGVMYDRIPVSGKQDEQIAMGWRTWELQNPGTTDPDELRRMVLEGAGTSRPGIVLIRDRLETPSNTQWSVGVGHRVGEALTVNLDWLDQRVRHMYVTTNANWLHPDSRQRAITNRLANVLVWDDVGDARFRALLASVQWLRDGTRLNLAYTLGWAASEFADVPTADYPDRASYTMQRALGDERHRLVLSGFTTLPRGFELSGIAIVASPSPFLVRTGTDDNRNSTPRDDWPHGVRTMRQDGWEHWYRTIDLRLSRSFPTPRGRVIATLETFNLLNSANHAEYQGTASQLHFGEPVGDYARRQMQLGLRWAF